MKTSTHVLHVTTPKSTYEPETSRDRYVTIATPEGDLMMNRLRRLMRTQDQTANLPEDDRFTVELPNELSLQIIEGYIRKSKAMRRKDFALDRKSEESQAWENLAGALYDALIRLSYSANGFLKAVQGAEGGGDALLAEIKDYTEALNGALQESFGIIEEIDGQSMEDEEGFEEE